MHCYDFHGFSLIFFDFHFPRAQRAYLVSASAASILRSASNASGQVSCIYIYKQEARSLTLADSGLSFKGKLFKGDGARSRTLADPGMPLEGKSSKETGYISRKSEAGWAVG